MPALLDGRRDGVRVWIDAGNAEGGDEDGDGWTSVVEDARSVFEGLVDGGMRFPDEIALQEDADGQHNERTWADRLPALMVWLWGEGPGPAQRLSIRLPFPTLLVGATTPISVDARYLGDVWLTVPRTAPQLESSDPTVLGVVGTEVEAIAAGEATLTARWGDLETTLDVTVVDEAHTPIEVRVPPETPADAMVWVAGDLATLGTWRADGVLLEAAGDGRYTGLLEIPPGAPFEYKITRGTWETVEKGPNGEEIENRRGIGGEPQRAEVVRWRDIVP